MTLAIRNVLIGYGPARKDQEEHQVVGHGEVSVIFGILSEPPHQGGVIFWIVDFFSGIGPFSSLIGYADCIHAMLVESGSNNGPFRYVFQVFNIMIKAVSDP